MTRPRFEAESAEKTHTFPIFRFLECGFAAIGLGDRVEVCFPWGSPCAYVPGFTLRSPVRLFSHPLPVLPTPGPSAPRPPGPACSG